MNRRRLAVLIAGSFVLCCESLAPAQTRTNVAVFNFQMKSQTPDWAWLEKGLADQITTHFAMAGTLNVIARDEMQAVARKVQWAPELAAGDPGRMKEIEKQLKIQYLVTGVYSVEGQRIKITAQVIEMDTRKELARKDVAGESKDVLDLQRKLASELLGWFWEKPAEQILEKLPVWTRSIPAAQATYEGMDLYDQGRYGEAWLKFRQAARDDGDYLEAQYWVGRMYYFMDRYEHARQAFERFVYMAGNHPRMGDAILEYLHTFEKLDAPPEQLLGLYADFQRRFPNATMFNNNLDQVPLTASAWLRVRSAQVLQQMGRFSEAVALSSGVIEESTRRGNRVSWAGSVWTAWPWRIGLTSAQAQNQLTGAVQVPKGITDGLNAWEIPNILSFTPGRTEITIAHQRPMRVSRTDLKSRTHYDSMDALYTVLAPEGYVLKKLTVHPTVDGLDGKINIYLSQNSHKDVTREGDKPAVTLAEACKDGLVISDIPRGGIFHMVLYIEPNNPWRYPDFIYSGLRAVAELEPVGPHGNILVSSPNASSFYVRVDGRRARKNSGLIGLVPPGRHKIQFGYGEFGSVFAPYEVEVLVEANKTTDVAVTLPWKPEGPLAGWTSGSLIGRDYPHAGPCLQAIGDAPAVQADQDAIRVFWTHLGDIWTAASTDGNTFSRPARLPMPISSGWVEQSPLCIRDESGRFLLVFLSDRDAQHRMLPYVCWSRDAKNWSQPTAIGDRAVNKFDLIQDSRGRFLWADATGGKVTILVSRDAYRWEPVASWSLRGQERAIRLLQQRDGSYELFVVDIEPRGEGDHSTDSRVAYCRSSKDAVEWSPPVEIRDFRGEGELSISALEAAGQTLVAFFEDDMYAGYWPFIAWARGNTQGQWERSQGLNGIGSYYGVAAYHPRWGFIISWRNPMDMNAKVFGSSREEHGPFLIRGAGVERFFQRPAGAPGGNASSTGGKPRL